MTVVPLRPLTIGGSDAGAAAGIDPYRSRVALWLEKTGRLHREETEAMRWETLLQPLIAEELAERGFEPMPAPADGLADPQRPWLVGHPDGYCALDGERGLLEIKTVGQWAHRASGGDVPLHYAAQVQHYLHLTGLGRALVALLVGGQRLETFELPRHDRSIRLLLEREEDFYGYLVRGEPPPPDGSESAREALDLLHPAAVAGRKTRLSAEATGWLEALRARRAQLATIEEQARELQNLLKTALGDAELGIAPNEAPVIRWANTRSTRTDVRALRAAHPELAAEYVTRTQTRRFTLL